jgi:hypothetical protein
MTILSEEEKKEFKIHIREIRCQGRLASIDTTSVARIPLKRDK